MLLACILTTRPQCHVLHFDQHLFIWFILAYIYLMVEPPICLQDHLWDYAHTHTHTRMQPFYSLLGFCPGLPGWASTRKVKPGRQNQSGSTGARDNEWQWHQLGHMNICTWPRHITMPASHHSVFTGQMPFLPPNFLPHSLHKTNEKLSSYPICTQSSARTKLLIDMNVVFHTRRSLGTMHSADLPLQSATTRYKTWLSGIFWPENVI